MRDALLHFLFSPVTRIKGVGPSVAKSLANLLPIPTQLSGATLPIVRDLLFHLPIGIIDRRASYPLRSAPDGVIATLVVKIEAHLPPKQKRFGKQPYKVICSNDTGEITLVFFNARDEYIKQALPAGSERVISGTLERFDFQLQMTHPDVIAPVDQLSEVQKIEPVYPLTAGLTTKRITKIIKHVLELMPDLPEWIDDATLREHGWDSFKESLIRAHYPQSADDLGPNSPARTRLAYDEMLATQLHLAMIRSNMQRQVATVIRGNGSLTDPLLKALPFKLTEGQETVLDEIKQDMVSGHRMTRLLQGDVGSGKTIVALLAMLKVVEDGRQAALMAPTELLAKQHAQNIAEILMLLPSFIHRDLAILLTGSIKGSERKKTLEKIASGDAKIIIGTHALFQEAVTFKNLSFIVVDEQHRFGVAQRLALSEKGDKPHLLHMTATPIPRSLALTLYGDMDISELKEKPASRQPITTRLIPTIRSDDVLVRLEAALARGEKAYWICPIIDDPSIESTDLAAAKSRYVEFSARFGSIVGLVHGRMRPDDRNAEMWKFAAGKTKLLVATTVVEVGVDVPDATIMVIERAERFGLAQLHQLRGRVGRGDKASACVLLYSEEVDSGQSLAASRLSILKDSEDGFKIAEADLVQRGSGEIMGVRQSGYQRFAFIDISQHHTMLSEARQEATLVLKSELSRPHQLLLSLFNYRSSTHDQTA